MDFSSFNALSVSVGWHEDWNFGIAFRMTYKRKEATRIRKTTECENEILGNEWSKKWRTKKKSWDKTIQVTERTTITAVNNGMNRRRTKKKPNYEMRCHRRCAVSIWELKYFGCWSSLMSLLFHHSPSLRLRWSFLWLSVIFLRFHLFYFSSN